MKGQALITIKDKNGKIKQQIKENNVVFDLPKELIKNILANAELGLANNNAPYSDYSSSNFTSIFGDLSLYSEWFRSIKVNDETCDTSDYKDWKNPVLWGGEIASSQSNRKRYAYLDGVNSTKTGNVMKKAYTWNDCPSFTLKSINLGHFSLQGASNYNINYNQILGVNSSQIMKYGKFYFLPSGSGQSANYKTIYYNKLYTKDGFTWETGTGQAKFEVEVQNGKGMSLSYTPNYQSTIIPMRNNEIALLRYDNDITTDESNQTYYVKYLYIIDATTGIVKRSFPLTQFNGWTGDGSAKTYFYYVYIMATDFGTFFISSKTSNTSNVFVWKIPEQSEMSDYSNNESIPVYADLSSTGVWVGYGSMLINNYLYCPNTLANEKAIRINDDAQNPYTLYNYVPFNFSASPNNNYNYCACVNKYQTLINGSSVPKWYNTTALNLSEGVEVAQGDTLTIEYTITAN